MMDVVTYFMRAYDSGTVGWVYWTATDPAATPLAAATTPNYTGTLGTKLIIRRRRSSVDVIPEPANIFKNFIPKPEWKVEKFTPAFATNDALVFITTSTTGPV